MFALRIFLPSLFCLLSVWSGPDGTPLPFQSTDEGVEFLRAARLVNVEKKKLGGLSGARKLVIENGGVRAHAVFRTVDQLYRNTWWDTGKFTAFLRDSYQNEIAAYELSRLLGLDTVPPTVPWVMSRRAGSLQLWIEGAQPGYNPKEERKPPDPVRWQMERERMRVFDVLIENVDRNIGNMLIDRSGRVWWIDHTRSFGRLRQLEDTDLINRCERRFYEHLKAIDPKLIVERLSPYLGPREIDALLDRRLKLIDLIDRRIARDGEDVVLFSLPDRAAASRRTP